MIVAGPAGACEPAAAGPISGWVSNSVAPKRGRQMLAEPHTSDGRDSATPSGRLSLREAFADVEQLAALVVFVPTAPGRAALGAPLLKALITSRELAIGTVLVMPPVVRAHDPAAGLGADPEPTGANPGFRRLPRNCGHRAESELAFASGMVSKTGGNELHSMLRRSTNQHRLSASGVS